MVGSLKSNAPCQFNKSVQKIKKRKEEGFKTINIKLSPKNIEILERYKTMKYHNKWSNSDIFDELIGNILKKRNKSMYQQGVKWSKNS